MPRSPRIEFPGAIDHVLACGNGGDRLHAELASRFRAPGSRLGPWRETVVTSCNEGLHAALPRFVRSKLPSGYFPDEQAAKRGLVLDPN